MFSLLINTLRNATQIRVCTQMICHRRRLPEMHPTARSTVKLGISLFSYSSISSFFISWRKRLEAVRARKAITTWEENDTLRVTHERESNPPQSQLYGTDIGPSVSPPHKQPAALTYSNKGSRNSIPDRHCPKSGGPTRGRRRIEGDQEKEREESGMGS